MAYTYGIDTPGANGLIEYRYCLRSKPSRDAVLYREANYSDSAINGVPKLAGDYSAFEVASGSQETSVPATDAVTVVDLGDGKSSTVPDAAVAAAAAPGGGLQSFVLSPAGVLAGIGQTYAVSATGAFTPAASYVLAYQESTHSSSVLAGGSPGSLSSPEIAQCVAGCSSTSTLVVGWTSSGTRDYSALPATG